MSESVECRFSNAALVLSSKSRKNIQDRVRTYIRKALGLYFPLLPRGKDAALVKVAKNRCRCTHHRE